MKNRSVIVTAIATTVAGIISTATPSISGSLDYLSDPVVRGPVRCTTADAREAMNSGNYSELCDCEIVTQGFLSFLRRQEEFADIVDETGAVCPALAGVLLDFPVANIPEPLADDDDGPPFGPPDRGDDDDDDDDDDSSGSSSGGSSGSSSGSSSGGSSGSSSGGSSGSSSGSGSKSGSGSGSKSGSGSGSSSGSKSGSGNGRGRGPSGISPQF